MVIGGRTNKKKSQTAKGRPRQKKKKKRRKKKKKKKKKKKTSSCIGLSLKGGASLTIRKSAGLIELEKGTMLFQTQQKKLRLGATLKHDKKSITKGRQWRGRPELFSNSGRSGIIGGGTAPGTPWRKTMWGEHPERGRDALPIHGTPQLSNDAKKTPTLKKG